MKRNTSPSAAPPLSHCVRFPSPFSFLLLSLVLWNSTCYRLAAWEPRHDVVCTPAWYSASSRFHIQPCWCARQTSWDIFILQELNDFLEVSRYRACRVLCSLCHTSVEIFCFVGWFRWRESALACLYLEEMTRATLFTLYADGYAMMPAEKLGHCNSNYTGVQLKKMQCTVLAIYGMENVFIIWSKKQWKHIKEMRTV